MNLRVQKAAALVAAVLLHAAPAPAQEATTLRLELNIPTNRIVVYDGERVLKSYPVSVGKPGYDTPDGTFTVDHAEWNPSWRPPPGREWTRGRQFTPPGPQNPMGRVKLFFEPLYFIHGTSEKEAIGSPASHGCVRMLNADVVELARLLHERAGGTLSSTQIDGVLRGWTTRHSRFRAPVPLVIRYAPVVVEDGELRIYPDVYRRNAVHTEAVYQALLASGYDTRELRSQRVNEVLAKARGAKSMFRITLDEAFGSALAARVE